MGRIIRLGLGDMRVVDADAVFCCEENVHYVHVVKSPFLLAR